MRNARSSRGARVLGMGNWDWTGGEAWLEEGGESLSSAEESSRSEAKPVAMA